MKKILKYNDCIQYCAKQIKPIKYKMIYIHEGWTTKWQGDASSNQ